jgi:hypothetical protein
LPDKKRFIEDGEKKMKKRALVSLVLLTFVTAGAVFAQSPTLDKLTFVTKRSGGKDYYEVKAINTSISGAVVIPGTSNNVPVTVIANGAFDRCSNITSVTIPVNVTSIGQMAFRGCASLTSVIIPNGVTSINSSAFGGCTNLASVTIPASVTSIGNQAFNTCPNLTSVTFGGSNTGMTKSPSNQVSFPGDLHIAYQAGGAGTYTRSVNGANWTKQGAVSAPAPAPAVNTSLDGWWLADNGMTIVVSGNTATILYIGSSPVWQDAFKKGYFKEHDEKLRNIRSTGTLTWTMQELVVNYNSGNVVTGTTWGNTTLTMSADGVTLYENGSVRWRRTVPGQ